jgi:hypothetical protein
MRNAVFWDVTLWLFFYTINSRRLSGLQEHNIHTKITVYDQKYIKKGHINPRIPYKIKRMVTYSPAQLTHMMNN